MLLVDLTVALTFFVSSNSFQAELLLPLTLLDVFYFQSLNINVQMVYKNKLVLISDWEIDIKDSWITFFFLLRMINRCQFIIAELTNNKIPPRCSSVCSPLFPLWRTLMCCFVFPLQTLDFFPPHKVYSLVCWSVCSRFYGNLEDWGQLMATS